MSPPPKNWRRWQGRLAGVALLLTGIGLILSDRIAARTPGDRPWIAHPLISSPFDPEPQDPWPEGISEIILREVNFQYTKTGSYLSEVLPWIERSARVKIEVNWHALAGVSANSTVWFKGTDVSLPNLLDALLKDASEKSPAKPKLIWEAQPDRVIRITTAEDRELQRQCKAQRLSAAGPQLRKGLDRKLPYVKLRELSLDEALRYCQRVSGVKIRLDDPHPRNMEICDVIAQDITFEELIERIIRSTSGYSPHAWYFKVEGEGLQVFRDGGGN
jgi:hypothetical protein